MLTTDLHECPRCNGAVNREHYAVARHDDYTETYLYCEFCEIGIETSTDADGDVFALTYQAKTEPKCFGKFLERLEAAQAG